MTQSSFYEIAELLYLNAHNATTDWKLQAHIHSQAVFGKLNAHNGVLGTEIMQKYCELKMHTPDWKYLKV